MIPAINNKKETKQITIKIDSDRWDWLTYFAREDGVTTTSLVKRLIAKHIDEYIEKRMPF